MDDAFTFTSSAFPESTRVAAFRGREEISRPYAFEVFLIVPGDDAKSFDVPDALGTLATLRSHPDRKQPVVFHGALMAVELVHAHDRFALFRATLAPRLQRLAHTHHSRLFTEMAVPDILKEVLEANGLTSDDYALQLSGSYAAEEHVCQYRESDLDFVSRWMEHLGLYYYFEQGDDAEKLIITDRKASQTDLPTDPVRYAPSVQDRSAGAAIETFRFRATSLPGSVRVKDYDYTKPTLDISGEAKVQKTGLGEISVYSARAFTPGDATKMANLRAEELLAGQLEHFGGGTMPLRAGYQFTLEEHPLDVLNQKYLATMAEHFGNLVSTSPELASFMELPFKDVYRCEVNAIPAKVQFRASRRTPWPRVYGFEHGLIDGAAETDYAQLDDHGRYRVKFFFDESPLKDGKASTWVRMMQPHGGGVEGFHFPLRKGTEVVLSFMGGDPDRPVIAGVVNTTATPSPVTSGNNTRNVIQTGGRNRIEIEDKEGQQRISISSPTANSYVRFGAPNSEHNMIINTDGMTLLNAGENLDVTVGTYLMEGVNSYVDETYGGYHNTRVGGTREHTVKGAVTESYKATHTMNVSAAQTLNIGSRTKTVLATENETTNGAYKETRNGAVTGVFNAGVTETINGNVAVTATGTYSLTTGPTTFKHGPVDCTFDAHHKTTIGATTETFLGAKNSNFAGGQLNTTLGLTVDAFAGIHSSNFAGASIATFAGANIAYNCGVKASHGAPVDLSDYGILKHIGGRMVMEAGLMDLQGGKLAFMAGALLKLGGALVKIG